MFGILHFDNGAFQRQDHSRIRNAENNNVRTTSTKDEGELVVRQQCQIQCCHGFYLFNFLISVSVGGRYWYQRTYSSVHSLDS